MSPTPPTSLRSPLAALSLQVQNLRRAGDEAAREVAVTRLAAGIERASRLIEQLLVLARQEATAVEGGRTEEVELREVARQVVVELSPAAHARGIDLGLLPQADARPGDGDKRRRCRSCCATWSTTPLKYTPAGGTSTCLVADGPPVRLVVEDSGPGIEPEARRTRACRASTASADPATKDAGSGLGLAIVNAIADRHGARLRPRPFRPPRRTEGGALPSADRDYLRRQPDMPAP